MSGGDTWLGLMRATEFAHEQALREQAHLDELSALLRSLFEVLDSLDRLVGASEPSTGLDAVRRQLVRALTEAGVALIDPAGEAFDPQQAEAVEQRPSAGVEPGTVVDVIRRGGVWRGRLLRTAHVAIAANSNQGR